MIEKLDEKLKDVPGVVYNFTQPLAMRLDEVISGVEADVAVMLFGDDPATLERGLCGSWQCVQLRRVLSPFQ